MVHTEKSSFLEIVYDYVATFLTAMVLLVSVFTFCFRLAAVSGSSMESTLLHNDRVLLFSHFYEPDYGDIVVINRYGDEPLIKRVIAKAGDTVLIDDNSGFIYRNGQLLKETYTKQRTTPGDLNGVVTVPEGKLFVLGDNRGISKDSRDSSIGMVREDDVVGKAVFRIWPLSRFGRIYGNSK
jgi:signal peptidase I